MKELVLSRLTRLYGGSLDMDFGTIRKTLYTNPRNKSWEIERGEYALSYYNCCWRIVKDGLILCGCADDENFIGQVFERYCYGARLVSCEFLDGITRRLSFSSGFSIDIFVCTANASEQLEDFTDFQEKRINFYDFLRQQEINE